MEAMLMLHVRRERIAASLAQLGSVQKSSEQVQARAERAWKRCSCCMIRERGDNCFIGTARPCAEELRLSTGSCGACMKAMLVLHDPGERIAASLARLSSVQRNSDQAHARAERAWKRCSCCMSRERGLQLRYHSSAACRSAQSECMLVRACVEAMLMLHDP